MIDARRTDLAVSQELPRDSIDLLTMDAPRSLSPTLSPGGYLIVDDYGAIPACRRAVTDLRDEHGIAEPIETIEWTVWRRGRRPQ